MEPAVVSGQAEAEFEVLRARLSAEAFRNALLLVFVVLGLNMIRRAIWYT